MFKINLKSLQWVNLTTSCFSKNVLFRESEREREKELEELKPCFYEF